MATVLFCPTTMGFYPTGLTGDAIGKDSIEVDYGEYELLAGQELVLNERNRPILKSSIAPTIEQLALEERAWRNAAIRSTEWLVNRHRDEVEIEIATTIPKDHYAQLLAYRQSLRDWPEARNFPSVTDRPVSPAWLSPETNNAAKLL